MDERKNEFFCGVRAELPIILGVAPFGMIYGILALNAGMPAVAAQSMSAVVFAGSAQFLLAQLYGAGTPALVMMLTVAVVNLRHALYSASVAPYLRHLEGGWKWLLGYLLTDEAYAVTILHYQATDALGVKEPSRRHWFYLGAGLALWTSWQVSTAVGIFLGAVIPESIPLDFTLPLTFIALVVPALRDRPGWAAALAAGVTAVAAYSLPYKLGLMAAAAVGIAVGLLVERRT